VLLVLAVGICLSAINVKYRDVRYVIPFVLQLGMFVTPVIYPLTFAPQEWRPLLYLNPLTGIVSGIRAALFGLELPLMAIGVAALMTGVFCVVSFVIFRHMERSFADVI
jgi:lipopolysaccharide transport system permease protein